MSTHDNHVFSIAEIYLKVRQVASVSNDISSLVHMLETKQIKTKNVETIKRLIEKNAEIKQAINLAKQIALDESTDRQEELTCRVEEFDKLYRKIIHTKNQLASIA